MKKNPLFIASMGLTFIGALNWGLVGVGNFLEMNLNLVNLLLGSMPTFENVVYVLVGVSSLVFLAMMMGHAKKCNV